MPKAAVLFIVLLLSPILTNSFALVPADMPINRTPQQFDFTSGIIHIDPDFFTKNDLKRYLIFGAGPPGPDLSQNSIHGIRSDSGFFYVSVLSKGAASSLASQGYHVMEDIPLDFHTTQNAGDISRISNITGSAEAQDRYASSGIGTVIAVVDTGVDFSNPDIRHSVARDANNHPIMLDPDGQGIILTNATFFASIDENQIIRNYSKPIPSHTTSSVYVTGDGVFLDVFRGGRGTLVPIYNSFFPQVGSSITFNGTMDNDMRIGSDNRNYIQSKSGVYHLGMMYQGALQGPFSMVQAVPVLVVDSFVPGVYDTIIPDLSTSWEDYTRHDLKPGREPDYDFDFTDEKPIILGSGNEFLVYDSDGDGRDDYTAGTAGARVLDVYGAITSNSSEIHDSLNVINGTLLPALDPDGEFFGVMTDFAGHGTSSAASITSRGQVTYDIYNNSKGYTITGVAPDAKILPVKALWLGDTVYGWLWSAGFDSRGSDWVFSGKPRVDVISNSWGVPTFPALDASPGMDLLSLILSALAVPRSLDDDYPGVTVVSSAGNTGHGYGTIGLPNASPFAISVGATTNNVFVGYGPFKDQPRFGNDTDHLNHVVDFSSRGPSTIGDPKPDIMSIGAYGFVPSAVLKVQKDSKAEPFSLFGGTSMAAPLVSGSAAVLIGELARNSVDYDPFLVKSILMSTATDLGNDPFTQGSGLANVESALNYVHGDDGVFVVYNDMSYSNIKRILEPAINNVNSTEFGFGQFKLPSHSLPMTGWFAGRLLPGERTTTTFTIDNPSDTPLHISVEPETMSLIKTAKFNGTTVPHQQDSIMNKSGTFAPNYIRLSEVNDKPGLGAFYSTENPIPDDSSLMILNANFEFADFMNDTSGVYADDLKISSLYLYDWLDHNNDTRIASDELSMVTRGGSWGTVQEIRVTDPGKKFDGTPLVGVYPVPTRYSYWLGDTLTNSTSMDYTISASYYNREGWGMLWPESRTVTVPANGTAQVDVTLVVPGDLQTGAYQGFLSFEGESHQVNAPVTFGVRQLVDQNDSVVMVQGRQSNDVLYGNGYTKGAFDMVNRYMAGDWRQYHFDIQDESIDSAVIELSWRHDDTNLAVFVTDPSGKIIHTNVPSGVFAYLLGWASLDWLGSSPFSEGGGFYPVKNKDDTSTVLSVPINQTGTYTLLTHTTLFGGNATTEPITLAARFTDISVKVPSETGRDSPMEEAISNFTGDAQVPIIQEVPQTQTVVLSESYSSFGIGTAIGIAIGAAIGAVVVLIIRQRPFK